MVILLQQAMHFSFTYSNHPRKYHPINFLVFFKIALLGSELISYEWKRPLSTQRDTRILATPTIIFKMNYLRISIITFRVNTTWLPHTPSISITTICEHTTNELPKCQYIAPVIMITLHQLSPTTPAAIPGVIPITTAIFPTKTHSLIVTPTDSSIPVVHNPCGICMLPMSLNEKIMSVRKLPLM